MGKGLGKRQRQILEAMERHGWIYLVDLLPEGYTATEYSALRQAARSLHKAKRINLRKSDLAV